MTDIKELLRLVAESPRADSALAKAALERIVELEKQEDVLSTICSEAYQVIAVLASDAGRINEYAVEKALDNTSAQALVHETMLPFPSAAQSKEQG